jgi:tetratricopeptide (TPR) repeat protein
VAALAGPAAPELGRLSATLGPEPPQAGDRRRLLDAVDAVLSGLAAERPLLLVLDDLQWADPPTLALLAHVARSTRPAPLLIAGTARRTAGTLLELRAEGLAEQLDLSSLAAAEVRELVAAAGGSGADELLRRSGGNAFLVGELVRAQQAGEEVPGGVLESVTRRLAALGEPAGTVVALAAVLGREVDQRVLAAAKVASPEELVAALEAALDAHLLREAADGLEFTHDLVREAVQAATSAPRRAALHRRAAEALEQAGTLEAAAAHLAHASPGPADAPLLARAGERALARAAYEDAATHLSLALHALGADDLPRRGPLLAALGEARLRAGAVDEARSAFRDAATCARATGDGALLARAALGHGGLGVVIARPEPVTIALLEEALATARGAERVRLLARLAVERYYDEPRGASERISAEAVAEAEELGDPTALVFALNARRVALWRLDRLAEREETGRRMLAVARAAGDREAELQARNWLVVDAFERGDGQAWRTERAEHERLADELRLPAYEWYGPLWRAVDAGLAGDLPTALRLTEEARMLGRRAGDRNADLFPDMVIWGHDTMRAEFSAESLRNIERAMQGSPAEMSYRAGLAWYYVHAGRTAEAHAIVEEVARDDFAALPFDVNWPSALGELAMATLLLPGTPRAQDLYTALLPYAGQPLTAGRSVSFYGCTARLLGRLAAALGREPEAVAHLEAGIAADEAFGAHLWAAQGRIALAAITGDGDLAREGLATARRANAPGVARLAS